MKGKTGRYPHYACILYTLCYGRYVFSCSEL